MYIAQICENLDFIIRGVHRFSFREGQLDFSLKNEDIIQKNFIFKNISLLLKNQFYFVWFSSKWFLFPLKTKRVKKSKFERTFYLVSNIVSKPILSGVISASENNEYISLRKGKRRCIRLCYIICIQRTICVITDTILSINTTFLIQITWRMTKRLQFQNVFKNKRVKRKRILKISYIIPCKYVLRSILSSVKLISENIMDIFHFS